MIRNKLFRAFAATIVGATVAGGAITFGWAGAAFASGSPPWEPDPNSVGGLVFYNAAGQQVTGGELTNSPVAAYVEGTSTIRAGDTKAQLFGFLPVDGVLPTNWGGESIGESTTFPNSGAPAGLASLSLPLETGASGDEGIGGLEADYPNTDTSTTDGYANTYQLRLRTSAPGLSFTAQYDSADILVNNTAGTWSVIYPSPTLSTSTTTLTTSPSGTAVGGTPVTLTATVSPALPGTVQFENGTTAIGSPVAVSGGVASISVSTLPVGSDTLNAVFTPGSFLAYSGSTGSAALTVTQPPAAGTTTALAVNPTTAAADTAVSITATVSQTSNSAALEAGAGSVAFYDDGTDTSGAITSNSVLLGTEALVSGGTASLTYASFATGAHNIVASFTPTDTTVYNASSSLADLFTATAPAILPASQTVDVSIPAGSLTITTPYSSTNPFQLGTAVLNPGQTDFQASAPFGNTANPANGVTITDTEAGDQSWTASATVTDFSDGSGDTINGQNLTFTGVTPSFIANNALQSGDVVVSNITNTAVYGPTAAGSDGLKGGPHEFATAANGDGSVYIDGVLTLTAPTSTPAGTYTATLTFTIV